MAIDARYRHCFETASAAAGRVLTEAELNNVFTRLQDRMARYMRDEGLTQQEAAQRAGGEIGSEHAAAVARGRANQIRNFQLRVERRQRIVADAEGALEGKLGVFQRKPGVANLYDAVRSNIEALNTPVEEGRFSAEAIEKSLHRDYLASVSFGLDAVPGARAAALSGAADRDIAREMYELSQRGAAGSFPGVSGNTLAQKIAQVLNEQLTRARVALNRQGAWIGDLPGYISRTTHDAHRIYKAGEDTWARAITPLLDDRTFEGVEDPRVFLGNIYRELITGTHISDAGGIGFKRPAFQGPGNLAKTISEGRVLQFRDADSWHSYQQQFGYRGPLTEQVLHSLGRAARQEALLRKFGTNPQAEFDSDLRWLKEKYLDEQPEANIALGQRENALRNVFNQLTGTANIPANQTGAQVSAFARNIASMSKLGFVSFTHLFSALVTKGPELRYQGANALEAYGNVLTSFVRSFNEKDQPEALRRLLATISGTHSGLGTFGWLDDSVPGTMSKITNQYFRMSGLNWLLTSQKRGAIWFMAHHLGELRGAQFDALPAETQRAFSQYGIDAAGWDTLRNAPDHPADAGNVYLTPDAAHRAGTLDPAKADDLALRLNTYYQDVADRSIITPGVGERALFLGSTQPGTVQGEVWRFIQQFKLWPTAMIRQYWGREVFGGNGAAGVISGVIATAAIGMLFGYGRMLTTDLLKGLTPRDPKDWRTWGEAMAQSGGFGILGDFLFGQTNRFGQGIAETLAGPVLGEGLNSLQTVWNNIKQGNPKPVPTELVRLATSNLPFGNLFYAKAGLQYLFLNSLMESLNPGYLRRSQQALQRNTGQTYLAPNSGAMSWMNPQNHIRTFGR